MYCSHFGLQRLPFNNTPDPTFYYSTPDHEEALATLQYATQQRKGFVLVSGEIGAGKTLIGRIFLRQMDTSSTTAVISQTNLTGRQLLAAICSEFGLAAPAEATNLELTQRLQEFLVEQFARNRFVVVLLDEAQNLPDESFEELRMLGNLEADDAKLLQVCILGQPELRERFSRPGMKQLEQRLFRRFHLPSLNRVQTGEYIVHRLGVAGCRNERLFTAEAVERVYALSGGVPRLINQICDNALLAAYGQDERTVEGRIIDLVVERDNSLVLQAPAAGRLDAVGAARTGSAASGADADDALDSVQLAELALEQTQNLCGEVAALASGSQPLRGELDRISQRQSELQKIVAGATTRWLAAKEKLDEYRKEIQSEIREVITRCHRTQERLQEVEQTAAPAEDLEEIRENHLRETNRLLKLMQSQRDEFQTRLEDVQKQWSSSEQELRRLAAQARADERFQALEVQCESATREVLGTVDRHRQSMLEHLGALRQQCESAQSQLHSVQAMFDRRTAEADRRIEQLRADQAACEKDVTALREQLDGWRRTLGQSFEDLKGRVVAHEDGASGPAYRRDLEQIRRDQAAGALEMSRRIDQQAAALQEFRSALEQAAADADLLGRGLIEQMSAQAAGLESRLDDLRCELTAGHSAAREGLDAMERAWRERLAAMDQRHEQDRESLREEIGSVREQVAGARSDLGLLAEFRERQTGATQLILHQLDDQRRSMRAECDALSELYRGIESGLVQLRGETASREDVEEVRRRVAADVQMLHDTLGRHDGELARLADRLGEQTGELDGRISLLSQTAARADDVAGIRAALAEQILSLSRELDTCQAQWSEAFERSREQADQTAGALLKLARQAATQDDLAAAREQLHQMEDRLDATRQHVADQQESARRDLVEALETRIHELRLATHEQISRIQERQRELAEQMDQELEVCASAQQAQFRRLEAQLTAAGQQAEVRHEALQARLAHANDEQARLEQRVERLQSSTTDQVSELHKRLSQSSVAQSARLEEELAVVHDAIEHRVTRAEDEIARETQEREKADRVLAERIHDGQARHAAAMADLDGRWQALRASLEQLARDTVPAETFNRVEQSLTDDVKRLRHQVTDSANQHSEVLRTLVEKVQETAGRVTSLENKPPPRLVELQPEVLTGLGKLVEAAESERAGLNQALERAGAVTAHFRNCSSQVQEIMEHWMSSAGDVRQQSEGLRTSAESARGILEAMRRCNAVLDAKLNSQRWRTQLERGEALTGRIEQAVHAAQGVVRRLELLMADFDAARTDIDVWEQRQKQADETAARLAELLNQAQSRQRLLSAVARNTSQLVEVIQAARIEDETQRPTQSPQGTPARAGNGHVGRPASRLQWAKAPSPATIAAAP